jgi:hypothetical protein
MMSLLYCILLDILGTGVFSPKDFHMGEGKGEPRKNIVNLLNLKIWLIIFS